MKKVAIGLSIAAALSTSSFGAKMTHDDLMAQIEALKAQIQLLELKVNEVAQTKHAELKLPAETEKRLANVEKKLEKTNKTLTEVKSHDAGDNIKFDVDFRTQYDYIEYKAGNGTTTKNSGLLTNRLWLGMGYQPNDNTIFKGLLSYNKIYGENVSDTSNNVHTFDWVTNEAAGNDNALNVKEVYWLYKDDKFMGANVPWTVSVGRRPSTDGLGINLRTDDVAKSPLAHTVNVEFDGASAKFDLDKITGVPGMWWKFCTGRGLTNANFRFTSSGLDYTADSTKTNNIDMAGFIFVPYDDGQYSIHTNWAYAWNLIGYDASNPATGFHDFGDFELANIVFKTYGIGDGISDYLDETTAFASFAMSKTHPGTRNMLGSSQSETGHSIWLGVNAPCPISPESAKIGVEWNKGSKYWRSFTYGEDTMIGSKVAARGAAWEIYRNAKINDALSWSLRFLKINYDYSGSNGFFGDYSAPTTINSSSSAVKEATNITANIRYKF